MIFLELDLSNQRKNVNFASKNSGASMHGRNNQLRVRVCTCSYKEVDRQRISIKKLKIKKKNG